jgi:hypothetical protein
VVGQPQHRGEVNTRNGALATVGGDERRRLSRGFELVRSDVHPSTALVNGGVGVETVAQN